MIIIIIIIITTTGKTVEFCEEKKTRKGKQQSSSQVSHGERTQGCSGMDIQTNGRESWKYHSLSLLLLIEAADLPRLISQSFILR